MEMYQELTDSIEVIALFEQGTLRPCRFRWRGKVHKVTRITSDWQSSAGEIRLRYFAVIDSVADCFQLCYDEGNCNWTLAKIWVD